MRCIEIVFAVAFVLFVMGAILVSSPLYTSTKYARGYSESRFKQIKPGSLEKVVRSALGNPLYEVTNSSGEVSLIYSVPDHRYLVFYYKSRAISLSNGTVASTWASVNSM